jgi:hypothetical protein
VFIFSTLICGRAALRSGNAEGAESYPVVEKINTAVEKLYGAHTIFV